MTLSLIELVQTGPSTWDVHLGEGDHRLDISNIVEYLHLELDAKERVPKVLLSLTAYPKFAMNAEVVVDQDTTNVLCRLGWTPPRVAGDPLPLDSDKVSDVLRDWREDLVRQHGDKPVKDVLGSAMVMAEINLKLAQTALTEQETKRG